MLQNLPVFEVTSSHVFHWLPVLQALRVNPNLVDVHNNLGDLWRAQGVVGRQAAQQCYLEALRLDVFYAPAWRGLGDLLRESGEFVQVYCC